MCTPSVTLFNSLIVFKTFIQPPAYTDKHLEYWCRDMVEQLTIFGECTSTPWTVNNKQVYSIASSDGHALYWELKCEEKGTGPEDFVLFLRTIFPSGGGFSMFHSNHSVVWSPMEDDLYAVGMRKLRMNDTWILAVLEVPEKFPGSSSCPDAKLSLLSCKFVAEEFLRGTKAEDLYFCDPYICKESPSWWTYLQKLQKVLNWKLPEVKNFSESFARISERPPSEKIEKKPSEKVGDRRQGKVECYDTGTSNPVDYNTRRKESDARSRSPVHRVVLNPRKEATAPLGAQQNAGSETFPNSSRLRCNRCNASFNQTYELMRHYNSEEHQAAIAREYPI